MFTTPEAAGPRGAATPTGDAPVSPRGPKGLWGALASASTPTVVARALPVSDAATLGVGSSMFDYDPALAEDLGIEFELTVG